MVSRTEQAVQLGDQVKDTITGLKGIVIGLCDYLYGCRRLVIQPSIDKDGQYVESIWVDEPQVKVLRRAVVQASASQRKDRPAGPRNESRIRNVR